MSSFSKYRLGIGRPGLMNTSAPSFTSHVVDAATDGLAWVFQAQDTLAITHLGFRYSAATGTPPTQIIGLEGVTMTTGNPDGTILGGGSPASAAYRPPADATWDGTFHWIALANSYTPTGRGQWLAVTIRYDSVTADAIDGSNNSSYTHRVTNIGITGLPYSATLTAGTWGGKAVSCPIFGVKTASTVYGVPAQSIYTTRTASTAGLRIAAKMQFSSGWFASHKLLGARICGSIAAAAGKTPLLGLWNGAGTALQSVSLDSDVPVSATATSGYVPHEFTFDEATLSTLAEDTDYYVGYEVVDAVNGGVLINGIVVADAADLAAFAGGTNKCLSTWNGAAWSDVAASPFIELILDDVTAPAGGGGIIVPGMSGGMFG
jgi:hypothetical protein